MSSVDHARTVRSDRAKLLAELRAGTRSPRDVFEHRAPSCALEMDAYDILLAVRGLGRERCRTIFERADVWPHTHVDELSTSQVEAILLELPARVE
jgi:hypothetical protein